jgi:hypothetical protein
VQLVMIEASTQELSWIVAECIEITSHIYSLIPKWLSMNRYRMLGVWRIRER